MAPLSAAMRRQTAHLLCGLIITVLNAPSSIPVAVAAGDVVGRATQSERRLASCFVPGLALSHYRLPLHACPNALRTSLDSIDSSSTFRFGQVAGRLYSRRVLQQLSDKDKQDKSQEDKSQDEAAKKEADEKDKEDEREVFWMFEKEKNFREELKAPTLLRVELDNYNVEGYPFAAVLPVQPLMVESTEDGVNVMFRKKPTKERGAIDGGLRVKVEEVTSITWDPHRWPQATRSKDVKVYSEKIGAEGTGRQAGSEREDPQRCTVMVTRIAEGQMVEKKFSEKLIVQRMLNEMRSEHFEHGRVISSFANDLSAPKGPNLPDPK